MIQSSIETTSALIDSDLKSSGKKIFAYLNYITQSNVHSRHRNDLMVHLVNESVFV